MGWVFAFIALICLWISLRYFWWVLSNWGRFSHGHLRALIVPAVFSGSTGVFGWAWWTTFRDKPSARVWGIAACAINALVCFAGSIYSGRVNWSREGPLFAVAVAGLVAFLWPDAVWTEGDEFRTEDEPS